jgi:hypothetical protein
MVFMQQARCWLKTIHYLQSTIHRLEDCKDASK